MKRKMISFELDHDMIDGLDVIRKREGLTASHQMREAIRLWLAAKGIDIAAARKGGAKRTVRRK